MLYTPPTTDSGSSSIRLSVKISIGGTRYLGEAINKASVIAQEKRKLYFLTF